MNLKAERLIIKVLTTKLKTIGQKYWEKIQIAISLKKKKGREDNSKLSVSKGKY